MTDSSSSTGSTTTTTTTTTKGRIMRLLIHPSHDLELFQEVTQILNNAVNKESNHWDHVTNQPATIDHYGYHDDMRSCVVFSEEYKSAYYRLTIRDIDDATHRALKAAVLAYYA